MTTRINRPATPPTHDHTAPFTPVTGPPPPVVFAPPLAPAAPVEKPKPPRATPAPRARAIDQTTHWTPPAKALVPRLHNAVLFTIVALTITIIGMLYLIQTSQVAGLGYEVSELERQRAAKALENQQLTYEVSRHEALPNVEQIARGELAMQPMEDYIFLTVPLPANSELPVPPPESGSEPSLIDRVWNRLTGEASASHSPADEASE